MKKVSLNLLAVAGLSLGLFAFTFIKEGGIKGKITPANGASAVFAIAGTDTLKADLNEGAFAFNQLKEGTYTVLVKGMAPYKDAAIENVAVKDSATTDLGEIKLQK